VLKKEYPAVEISELFINKEPVALTFGKCVAKLWGKEEIIANYPTYCSKILTLSANGIASSIHFHKKKHETFRILKGKLFIQVFLMWNKKLPVFFPKPSGLDYELCKAVMLPGEILTLPPFVAHRFWAFEPTEFLEASDHDNLEDTVRLVPSGPIPDIPKELFVCCNTGVVHKHLQ